ncbi:MAG: TIGR01906 family membrane protein [Clostridia bacterium]|nr:TIGR01906 family membrane protein [Clostridia bacterium]MBR4443477.1 TIGR01906 family membrane protein [Clostridia bacterium]
MKNAAVAIACALGLIALTCAGLLTGLETVFLDANRYTALMDELDVYPDVGLSREEQVLVNGDLAAYLAGRSDSLDRRVTLRGEAVESPFNDREKRHMADVRRLFRWGLNARALCAAAGLALMAAGLLFGKRRARRWGVLLALGLMTAAAVAVIAALRRADFNALFIRFHELVFTNDLWLLDPATDAMIRMLPEPFFEGMAAQGGVAAILGALAAFLGGALLLNIPGRRKKNP